MITQLKTSMKTSMRMSSTLINKIRIKRRMITKMKISTDSTKRVSMITVKITLTLSKILIYLVEAPNKIQL